MFGKIELQSRDIDLLRFLGEYKIMSLDNTRYIYGTKTYQEKRIVKLVQHNYIKRLKHRYIELGKRGKEYLNEIGVEIKEHCRNENNLERLLVISDIASCLIKENFNFIPSWNLKNIDEPTTFSRRYIGKLEYYEQDYLVYAIYEGKNDKYIKSIYYDIRKEQKYRNIMIFTDNIEEILLYEKGFFFGNNNTVIVPYNNYGKYLVRNNDRISESIFSRIDELYGLSESDLKFADFKVNDVNYVVIMPVINMEKIARIQTFYYANSNVINLIHICIFGLEEYENTIIEILPYCRYKGLSKEKIYELLKMYNLDKEGDENELIQNK